MTSRATPERAAVAKELRSARGLKDRDLRFDKMADLKNKRDAIKKAAAAGAETTITPEHHARLDRAFKELDAKNRGSNFVPILDLRRKFSDLSRPQFDALARQSRVAGKFSGNEHEGLRGTTSKAQRKAGIRDAGANLVYLSRREP